MKKSHRLILKIFMIIFLTSNYCQADLSDVVTIVENGLKWLESKQAANGSWGENVGHTAMATLAFLNAGYTEEDSVVSKGLNYLISNVKDGNEDIKGAIYNNQGHDTYMTSLSIMTLIASRNNQYDTVIQDAVNHLLRIQNSDGGWGYNLNSRSDLSNTQFPLMALSAALLPSDHNVWDKAKDYLNDRQNDDGGFTYGGGGNYTAWASMTAAGIWGLRLCGIPESDKKVQSALTWLYENDPKMTFDINTSHEDGHKYYYYLGFAKALAICFLSPEQKNVWYSGWYEKLKEKIKSEQKEDGSWSVDTDGAYGDTCFALLALESKQPPPVDLWMAVILHSPANLVVYDPNNYICSEAECTIPGANFELTDSGEQKITLPQIEAGHYRFVLLGTDDGTCHLTVKTYRSEQSDPGNYTEMQSIEKTIDIQKNEIKRSDVLLSSMVGALSVHIDEAIQPKDVNTGEVLFDFDGDLFVSIKDLNAVAKAWNTIDSFFDFDRDGIVTVLDIMKVSTQFRN